MVDVRPAHKLNLERHSVQRRHRVFFPLILKTVSLNLKTVYFSFNISKTNHSQNLNLYYVVSAHAYRTNRLQTTPAFVSNISVQSR